MKTDRITCGRRGFKEAAKPIYFVATHPGMFRCGIAAEIVGVVAVNGRACFHLRYTDGAEDYSPIVNEDFTGKGGFGYSYEFREMP